MLGDSRLHSTWFSGHGEIVPVSHCFSIHSSELCPSHLPTQGGWRTASKKPGRCCQRRLWAKSLHLVLSLSLALQPYRSNELKLKGFLSCSRSSLLLNWCESFGDIFSTDGVKACREDAAVPGLPWKKKKNKHSHNPPPLLYLLITFWLNAFHFTGLLPCFSSSAAPNTGVTESLDHRISTNKLEQWDRALPRHLKYESPGAL